MSAKQSKTIAILSPARLAFSKLRKEQVRWLSKGDIAEQVAFVAGLLGLAAIV
jgi:hypothetical protein